MMMNQRKGRMEKWGRWGFNGNRKRRARNNGDKSFFSCGTTIQPFAEISQISLVTCNFSNCLGRLTAPLAIGMPAANDGLAGSRMRKGKNV
jgi:hypothetical protein